jgi:NAD(P)-dependent dehydrogenase (short-subunit alcohol dehydrogenase family)
MRLKDRVAIITGAAGGIGQEFCYALWVSNINMIAAIH